MQLIETIQLVLWYLAPVGQVTVVFVMIRHRLIREVPWFFAYTIFHLIQFVVTVIAYQLSYRAYFYSYWTIEAIDALLVLIVIQEIYNHVFRPFDALRGLSTMLFRWAVIVLLAISLLVAASASGTESDRLIASLLIMDRSACFVQCALIFLLFMMKQAVGLPWRRLSHGIAMGLGLIAASTSITMTVRAYSHQELNGLISLVLACTYDLAIVGWIAILLQPEPIPDRASLVPSSTLQKWDTALLELMNK